MPVLSSLVFSGRSLSSLDVSELPCFVESMRERERERERDLRHFLGETAMDFLAEIIRKT